MEGLEAGPTQMLVLSWVTDTISLGTAPLGDWRAVGFLPPAMTFPMLVLGFHGARQLPFQINNQKAMEQESFLFTKIRVRKTSTDPRFDARIASEHRDTLDGNALHTANVR